MKLSILGAGAWGTALAVRAALRHEVMLWARDPMQVDRMRAARCNARYLDGVTLSESVDIVNDLDAALAHAQGGLTIIATPMAALEAMLLRVSGQANGVFWLCKGFQQGTGRLGHEIARDVAPGLRAGVLSGPSFAAEVARGQPTALVAATPHTALAQAAVDALHDDSLRIYTSDDICGVEIGGAVKNVLAIATGIADGLALGLNARAALITRGLAEMARLGVALGARADTFMGLAGLGDLVLTATGDLSRNRRVGLLLAGGRSLTAALAELGHVAEGVQCAATVLARANAAGVDMPLTQAVVDVLEAHATPAQAVRELMEREAKAE